MAEIKTRLLYIFEDWVILNIVFVVINHHHHHQLQQQRQQPVALATTTGRRRLADFDWRTCDE